MNIIFTRANKEDCSILSRLKNKIWNTTYRGIYSDDKLDKYDYKEHENKFSTSLEGLYVIKDDEIIIGYFHFGISNKYSYKDYKYSINSLYLLKEYQNKGIGSKVFEFIKEYCKKNNITKYYTCVNKYNTNAYNFYLKMGGRVDYLQDDGNDKETHQYYITYEVKDERVILPILDHYYDDEGVINAKSYLSQRQDAFAKVNLLREYNIDTALFIFLREIPSELEAKLEEFYIFKNASNKNSIYIYDKKFIVALSPLGGPGAAGLMEELGFMGITKFYACGSAGQIDHNIDGSKFLLVEKAIRDEGVSYHYIEPSLYVETDKELTKKLECYLTQHNFKYIKGTTWTCDAFYRETPKTIERRLAQGAISVEMECASWCGVSKFRNYKFAQLLYFSDALNQEGWKWKVDKKELKYAIVNLMIDYISNQCDK